MTTRAGQRLRAVCAVLATLVLAACLIAPGGFTSELDIRKDGRFTYSYAGTIHLLPLNPAAGSFTPKPFAPACMTETGSDRPCSSAEIAEQKAAWQSSQAFAQRQLQSMKVVMGGIDLSSPEAGVQLSERLRGQAGWKRVEYQGGGRFLVDFSLSGRLDHDFAFPSIEQMPMMNAFVRISARKDGSVRIDAPGFDAGASSGAMRAMGASLTGNPHDGRADGFPRIDGTFALRTDGVIVANNADGGPRPDPAGRRLDWRITQETPAAPMAEIRLLRP